MKTIYVLSDYNWERVTLVKEGKKNMKVLFYGMNNPSYIAKEKCALPDEVVAVVWETWRGKNGRGGYRVERELYPQFRKPASQIPRQHAQGSNEEGRVTETAYGVYS